MTRKILFVIKHPGAVRNFESTIRLLAERGHTVHLAFEKGERGEGAGEMVRRLCEQCPNVTQGFVPSTDDEWALLRRKVRLGLDYLPYLEPRYRDAPRLRERVEVETPAAVRRATRRFPLSTTPGRRTLRGMLRTMDQCIPTNPAIDAYLWEQAPDLMLITPLVELGSPQADFVRSAQALGIRTVLCVHSWDNLTNKGLIRDTPEMVAVWNNAQKREAVEMHGVPPARVAVTGAMPFDQWFERRPSASAEAFHTMIGLRPDRPYVLYLCSSRFIASGEATFVREWLGRLRSADDADLREVGVLIRPHPQNAAQWQDVDLSAFGNVTVWPRAGADPTDEASRVAYFDSMYHSSLVVGVNTTALIESAVVGRPVYTLLAPEFEGTQGGTLHFQHLVNANGGLLHVAETFDAHLAQLGDALRRGSAMDQKSRAFVEEFVRPYGLDVPATPRMVDAVEALCDRPAPAPRSAHRLAGLLHGRLLKQARAVNAAAAAQREKEKARIGKPRAEIKPVKPLKVKPPKAGARRVEASAAVAASSASADGRQQTAEVGKAGEPRAAGVAEGVSPGDAERREAE